MRFNDRKCDGFAMVYTYIVYLYIIVYVCVVRAQHRPMLPSSTYT